MNLKARDDNGNRLVLVCSYHPPSSRQEGVEAPVDCREALLAPAAELTSASQPLRALLDACRDDPARFQAEVLGRRLWAKQVEVCGAIARSPITVVPAGRAVGKSFLLAGLVLWWLYTRPRSLVITTGPDHRQVVSVLWKEIRRALRPRLDTGGPPLVLGHDHLSRQGLRHHHLGRHLEPQRRLDPHRENHVPFYCGGIPEWPDLRQELAELRSPGMEIEEGQVKQVLEDKESLAARLHRSPDVLDALLMTFTFSEQ